MTTQAPTPTPARGTRTSPLNIALISVLLALLLAAWLLSWRGTLTGAWPHVLLNQSGTFSYLLLALACTLGPLIGTRFLPQWLNAGMKTGWHGVIAGFALVTGAIHGAFATVAEDMTVVAVIVPGLADNRVWAMAVGTIGLWTMLVVYVTYALRGRIGMRAARALHLLAYVAFVTSTLHSVWLGHGGVSPLYVLCSLAVGVALTVRLLTLAKRPLRSAR